MLQRPGVIDLFGEQFWVAHVRQLAEHGVHRGSIARAVQRGTLCRVLPGIVAIPKHWDSFEGRCMVAQLAGGPRSFLSGMTAARLYGLRAMPPEPVLVTTHESFPRVVPSWTTLIRTSWLDDAPGPTRTDRLRVSSPPRMLFDLAARMTDERFARAAEDAWHLGLVTPEEGRRYLQRIRRSGRSGVARFERWLDAVEASGQLRAVESGLEQLLVDLAMRAGLPQPTRQHPITLPNGRTVRLDLAWPDVRFAIEPGHSWWHGGDKGQRADQERDRACATVGWQVVRYDETVWQRRDATVGEIRSMYRARARAVG